MTPVAATSLQEEFTRLWAALWPSLPTPLDLPEQKMRQRIEGYRLCNWLCAFDYHGVMVDAALALGAEFGLDRWAEIPCNPRLGDVDDLARAFTADLAARRAAHNAACDVAR